MLLRIFGVLVGLLIILHGLAVMDGALIGPGPCRPHCGLYRAVIDLIGQSNYNLLRGVAGIAAGLIFIYTSTFILGRDKLKRKKRRPRKRR